ncbi:MAG: hypothetical protein K0A93_10425 [Desulfuromonadaceae bacterium]|nr:hypothetical protein [Desulfuromonadaceae bacterium]
MRKIFAFIVSLLFFITICSCDNTDKEARNRLNSARVLIANNQLEKAEILLEKIHTENSNTEISNEALNDLSSVRRSLLEKRENLALHTVESLRRKIEEYYSLENKYPSSIRELEGKVEIESIDKNIEALYLYGDEGNVILIGFYKYGNIAYSHAGYKVVETDIQKVRDALEKTTPIETYKGIKQLE